MSSKSSKPAAQKVVARTTPTRTKPAQVADGREHVLSDAQRAAIAIGTEAAELAAKGKTAKGELTHDVEPKDGETGGGDDQKQPGGGGDSGAANGDQAQA